jgi:hypothetical protein
METKILFFINSELIHFGLAHEFQKNSNVRLWSIYDVPEESNIFFQHQNLVKFEKSWFYRLSTYNFQHDPDINYLKEFEKKYGINIWSIAYSERYFYEFYKYRKFSDTEILSILEHECKFFEKILLDVKPDFLFLPHFASHQSLLLCEMCKKLDIEIRMLTITRVGYRASITSHYEAHDQFDQLPNDVVPNTSQSKDQLQNYLFKRFHMAQDQKEHISKYNTRSSSITQISKILLFILTYKEEYRKFYFNFGKTRWALIKKNIVFKFRHMRHGKFLSKITLKAIPSNQNYVYFPLHVEPERTLSIESPFYTNQLSLLPLIAKSLPLGYTLLVREHPLMGTTERGRPESFYKKILEMPNVSLIDSSVSSHDVIQNSSAVITINGTSGLEALFLGKPTITFTETVYSFLPGVFTIDKIDSIPKKLNLALNSKININDLNKFVDLMEYYTFEFNYHKLINNTQSHFYIGNKKGNSAVNENSMQQYLKTFQPEFQTLSEKYLEKMKHNTK